MEITGQDQKGYAQDFLFAGNCALNAVSQCDM